MTHAHTVDAFDGHIGTDGLGCRLWRLPDGTLVGTIQNRDAGRKESRLQKRGAEFVGTRCADQEGDLTLNDLPTPAADVQYPYRALYVGGRGAGCIEAIAVGPTADAILEALT
jgi:hypothetical protein